MEIALRLHIYPHIGSLRIGAIRRSDIQTMVSCWNASVARKYLGFVTIVFNAAVLDDVIRRSPVRSISLPPANHHEMVIPTSEQVVSIADEMGEYRELVMLAASTGLRRAELLAVTLSSADVDGRSLYVRETNGQVVWPKGKPAVVGPPKTPAAVRLVPMGDVACDAVTARIERMSQLGRPIDPDDGYGGLLFRSAITGGPLTDSPIGNRLLPIMRRHGFPPRSGMHVFRHFYASALIESGASVKVVQKRLGHVSAVETLDTYGHLWPESDEASRVAIDEAFRPNLAIVAAS